MRPDDGERWAQPFETAGLISGTGVPSSSCASVGLMSGSGVPSNAGLSALVGSRMMNCVPVSGAALHFERAAVVLHDALRRWRVRARSLLLRRVERDEDVRAHLLGDALAGVGETGSPPDPPSPAGHRPGSATPGPVAAAVEMVSVPPLGMASTAFRARLMKTCLS